MISTATVMLPRESWGKKVTKPFLHSTYTKRAHFYVWVILTPDHEGAKVARSCIVGDSPPAEIFISMAVKYGGCAVSLINLSGRRKYVVLMGDRPREASERVHAVLWDGVMNLWRDVI